MADRVWSDRDIGAAFKAGAEAVYPQITDMKLEGAWWHSETRKEIERAKRERRKAERQA